MGRRGHGEGTIYKYKNGYAAAVHLGWRNGKRDRRFVYGKTQAEVIEKMKALRRSVDDGQRVDRDMLLSRYFERWVNDVLPGTVRPSTEDSYRDIVTRHIVPFFGKTKLTKLTPADVRKFLRSKEQETNARGKPHSPRSVQYMHAVLRRGLEQARRDEIVLRNVATLVEPPKVRRPDVEPFDETEAMQLLKTAKSDRLYALYVLALALGLRKGELLGLTWDAIDLDNRTLFVKSSLQRLPKRGLFMSVPKTLRSKRLVPLPEICVRALVEHRSAQMLEKLASSVWINEFDLVFTTSLGTPIEPRNLTRHYEALCKKAGIRKLRFHDLRHTCASLLFAQGVEARTIMDTLGHSTIGTTMNLYTHVMPVTRRDAAEKMDRILGSKNGSTEEEELPDAGPPASV